MTVASHYVQVLLARASKDWPADNPPPLRFIRSCSSSLAAATLHKLEEAFKVPVLEVHTSLPLPALAYMSFIHMSAQQVALCSALHTMKNP